MVSLSRGSVSVSGSHSLAVQGSRIVRAGPLWPGFGPLWPLQPDVEKCLTLSCWRLNLRFCGSRSVAVMVPVDFDWLLFAVILNWQCCTAKISSCRPACIGWLLLPSVLVPSFTD